MSTLPKPVNMTAGGVNRDYASIFADLINLVPHYTPEWTYLGDDDFGVVMLQLMAYLGDHLHYRADVTMRDMRMASCVQRDVLSGLSEWLGYSPKRKAPATGSVTFTLEEAQSVLVTIPVGSRVSATLSGLDGNNNTNINFETLGAGEILAGSLSTTLEVVEGATQSLVSLGSATGAPYEIFEIEDPDAIFSHTAADLTVVVGTDTASLVRWPSLAKSDQLSYWVRDLPSGGLELRFGNGSFGKLLSAGDEVHATYRRGGGVTGLVAAGTIDTLSSTIFAGGSPVTLTVTNATRTIGGSDMEDIEDIRYQAPAYFRTQNRAVTLEDYKTICLSIDGVYRANPVRTGVNGVLLYVVPDNASLGSVLSSAFMSRVVTFLDGYRMATDVVDVAPASLVPIDVELNCFAFEAQRNATVRRDILEAFTIDGGILSAKDNDLGEHLRRSDMVNLIEDVEGLDYVDVLKYTRRPSLYWKFATGNAAISSDGITVTPSTVEEHFSLIMYSATQFHVTGSITGLQSAEQGGRGTLGTKYTASFVDGTSLVSFTLEAGTLPMSSGDHATIRVSALASNIQLGAHEFPVAGSLIINVVGGIR
jgi:hypothetical protein